MTETKRGLLARQEPRRVGRYRLLRGLSATCRCGNLSQARPACLRKANQGDDEGRRAILATAAFTWETLANDIDDAANRGLRACRHSMRTTIGCGRNCKRLGDLFGGPSPIGLHNFWTMSASRSGSSARTQDLSAHARWPCSPSRLPISRRKAPKSMGLITSPEPPPSLALRRYPHRPRRDPGTSGTLDRGCGTAPMSIALRNQAGRRPNRSELTGAHRGERAFDAGDRSRGEAGRDRP